MLRSKGITMMTYRKRQKSILLNEKDLEKLRQQILDYFTQTFKRYEDLFTCLKSDSAYYLKANRLRHPLIFYYAHTATFYINKLILMKLIPKRINEMYESMFAVGVDEMSWDDLDETHYDWPRVSQIQSYRDQVLDIVSDFIKKMPLKTPITQSDPAWIILMGIEHEQIHLETSSVLIRELPLEYVQNKKNWQPCLKSGKPPENSLLPVKGGKINLAKTTPTYGWDNEYGQAELLVDAFQASQFLVSNAEYFAFIQADGYIQKKCWSEEGWRWCEQTKSRLPYFWRERDGELYLRLLTQEIPLPWDWPVEVNYYEAEAFCHYLAEKTGQSIHLPSEAQWRIFADQLTPQYPFWETAPANIDLAHHASSCPINTFKQGDFYDVIGNVWQWTRTPIYGFSGFEVHAAYDDFSVPTFDEKHHIFKGGSWISCGNEALLESRYAFRKHFFQHAGIRYVESSADLPIEKQYYNAYSSDALLGQYFELHYGADYFQEKNFLQNIIAILMENYPNYAKKYKCLDMGCAVGRSSFELARYFDEVIGVDFSARFIQAADRLKKLGKINYQVTTEGSLTEEKTIKLKDLKLAHENIKFLQGDACNLHAHLTDFDLILASNLIDRLYDPQKFLISIKTRLVPEGILAISSPYTWLAEHTEPNKWLGGYFNAAGKAVTTFEGLNTILTEDFDLIAGPIPVPFVIRETARKFQHNISELTIWQKRRLPTPLSSRP